ncbi:hypothetical protein NQZ68_021041 [Dissostichus eleginoides]|nr:hypothetical protein NQZ68_021041 [Dissostichus eleginoides]
MRKRARLSCGTVEFHFLKSYEMVLLAACIRKQAEAELRKVSEVKWLQGLSVRQEADKDAIEKMEA